MASSGSRRSGRSVRHAAHSSPTLSEDQVQQQQQLSPSPTTTQPEEQRPQPDDEGAGIVTRDLAFDTRLRKRKAKEPATAGAHDVTFAITVAFAVPLPLAEEDIVAGESRKINHFHIKYWLFPDEQEPYKFDVVLFGHEAARVYSESPGGTSQVPTRSIRLWGEGDQLWVAWQQSFQVSVTDQLLLGLSTHTFELKVWDAKDKCSSKAKFEKRYPQLKNNREDTSDDGVCGAVCRLSRMYERKIPTRLWLTRPLPHAQMQERAALAAASAAPAGTDASGGGRGGGGAGGSRRQRARRSAKKEEFGLYAVTRFDTSSRRTYRDLERLAGAAQPDADDFKATKSQLNRLAPAAAAAAAADSSNEPNESATALDTIDVTSSIGGGGGDGEGDAPKAAKTARRTVDPEYERNGRAQVCMNVAALFTTKNIVERLAQPVLNIEDAFVQLSISEPLLSEEQRDSLNPLTIRLRSAHSMPLAPYDRQQLRELCEPVHCQYSFLRHPTHRTAAREHDDKIVWDDVMVVLTGRLDEAALWEFLKGPGLCVEVHDRRRRPEEQKLQPALFGDDLEDEKISSVALIGAKRTAHPVFGDGTVAAWDPYGVAQVELSGLLHGQRLVELEVPILRCEVPDALGLSADGDNRVLGVSGAVDGPTRQPLEPGDYVNSGSTLKVMLQLAKPLLVAGRRQAAFGRIVLSFSYKDCNLLHRLQQMLRGINSAAFGLLELPEHAVATALTSKKLSSSTADINAVSGFHLADGKRHVFVVEGLIQQAVQSVWTAMQPRTTNDDLRVTFNTDVTFTQRMYWQLGLDFPCVRLCESLDSILEQSVLYVRDAVPRDAFRGLSRLKLLIGVESMLAAVRNDSFPTADMLTSIAKQFSVPMSIDDMVEMEIPEEELRRRELLGDLQQQQQHQQQHSYLPQYQPIPSKSALQLQRARTSVDFVSANRHRVQEMSDAVRQQRVQSSPSRKTVTADSTFNYSTQSLNSTELAKAKIREQLPSSKRFTYIQQYHNAGTVVPVDIKQQLADIEARSRSQWKTTSGWTCPGHRSSAGDNQHARRPHPARLDDLNGEWVENELHVAELQPTVPGRDPFCWDQRDKDLDIWRAPRGRFGQEPYSIFPTGTVKEAEAMQLVQQQQEEWLKRVVVEDVQLRTHRRLPQTEATERGRMAGNQLDRLQGLLKDPAQKYGFVYPGAKEVPALSVHSQQQQQQQQQQPAAYMPGDQSERSLFVNCLLRREQGRGFRLVCDDKSLEYRRRVLPLTQAERRGQLQQTARGFMSLPKMTETIKGSEMPPAVA